MKPADDWARWGDTWRQQRVDDIEYLRQQVERMQRQRRREVVQRWLGAMVATALLAYLVFGSGFPLPEKVWAALVFPVLLVALYLRVHVLRGIQYQPGASVRQLLDTTVTHTRTRIRLLQISIGAVLIIVLVAISTSIPWLMSRPASREWSGLAGTVVVIVVVGTVNLAVRLRALRRQRGHLRALEALLQEAEDVPAA